MMRAQVSTITPIDAYDVQNSISSPTMTRSHQAPIIFRQIPDI